MFVSREALVAQPLDVDGLVPSGEIDCGVAGGEAERRRCLFGDERRHRVRRSRFEARLVWRDRTGHEISEVGGPGKDESPAVSPDGGHILFSS